MHTTSWEGNWKWQAAAQLAESFRNYIFFTGKWGFVELGNSKISRLYAFLFILLLAKGKSYIASGAVWKGKSTASELLQSTPGVVAHFPIALTFSMGLGPQLNQTSLEPCQPSRDPADAVPAASRLPSEAREKTWHRRHGASPTGARSETQPPALLFFSFLTFIPWCWAWVLVTHVVVILHGTAWESTLGQRAEQQGGGPGSCKSHEGSSGRWRN